MASSKPTGFNVSQIIGLSIVNPRTFYRIPIPRDLTPEQLAKLEAWIDEENAKLAAEDGVSRTVG